MARSVIPVDLTNPGQVFACLGFMEAAEILCGPCTGRFLYLDREIATQFAIEVDGAHDPVASAIGFLHRAQVASLAPLGSELETGKWGVETIRANDESFPCPEPDSPAALPIRLADGAHSVPIGHWADDSASGRDNVKFWAGAKGYPGAALARDALRAIQDLGGNSIAAAAHDPFSLSAPQSSSFRFDWRRDYIPLDSGFSPNKHRRGSFKMVGYPLVELLAAIGMQNARPARVDRRDKLAYRYGVSNAALPTVLARAVLGAQGLGFPLRSFRMRLGRPDQEARCIIDAQEEFAA